MRMDANHAAQGAGINNMPRRPTDFKPETHRREEFLTFFIKKSDFGLYCRKNGLGYHIAFFQDNLRTIFRPPMKTRQTIKSRPDVQALEPPKKPALPELAVFILFAFMITLFGLIML